MLYAGVIGSSNVAFSGTAIAAGQPAYLALVTAGIPPGAWSAGGSVAPAPAQPSSKQRAWTAAGGAEQVASF